jgi:hypothetical protein
MLRRRELLLGALGAGVVGTLAGQVVRAPAREQRSVDPLSFGARGDGKSDDLAALKKAFAYANGAGLPVDGGDRLFAVRGNLTISGANRPWIGALRLKQLDPGSGRKTLHFDKCEGIRIGSLQIDVGSARALGDMTSSGGLWIDGGSNHDVRNVEVFGHGKNSLIVIWGTSSSVFDALTARDAVFDDPKAGDDVVQGIWMNLNRDAMLRNATVSNLTGNASYVGQKLRNLRTRGITLGGNVRVSVVDAQVRNVEQGIDLTGSEGNRQCTVIGGRTTDCGSVGVKLANSAVGCRVEGHVAERIGMYAFLASGPAEAGLRFKTQDCDFIRCTAIDAGYNRISYPNPSGFQVRRGDHDLDFPKGIRFIECVAIDRQAAKTMKFGFYSDVPTSASGGKPNELVNCRSEGHKDAARSANWR